jgi:hypothetical protein
MCPDIRHYGKKVNSSDASPSRVSWVFFYTVRVDANYFVVQSLLLKVNVVVMPSNLERITPI